MRFEKQAKVNSISPTRTGVISSPDPRQQTNIQRIQSPDVSLRNQVPRANVGGGAFAGSDPNVSTNSVGEEDFVTEESERHHMVNDATGVNIHRR